MAEHEGSSSERVRSLIAQLDAAVKNAERVRRQVEAQMRRRPVYPERRQPRQWERLPDSDTEMSEQEWELTAPNQNADPTSTSQAKISRTRRAGTPVGEQVVEHLFE